MYKNNKIGNKRIIYVLTNKEIIRNIRLSIDHRSKSMIKVYGLRVQDDHVK